MPDEQASFHSSIPVVLTPESTTETSIVPVEQPLSPEDKMIFYAVLQDIANELRRMSREQKKHQAQREHLH